MPSVESVIEVGPPERTVPPIPRRPVRRAGRFLLARAFWPVVACLLGLNAWWYHDRREPPDLKTIASLIEAGRSDQAEGSLRRRLDRSPHDGEARVVLARLLATRNDFRGCALQLRAVPFWSRLKPEALFREGQTWMSLDRARDAEQAFRAYIVDDPNHPVVKPYQAHAEVELANLLTLENRFDEVRAILQAAFPRSEGVAKEELLILCLRTELERWSPRAAYQKLSRFVAADPEDHDARLALAMNAELLGRPGEADTLIKSCLAARPLDRNVWRTWLGMLDQRGDLDRLRQAVAAAAVHSELAATARPFRARLLTHEGDLEAARDEYRQAIADRPFEAELQYHFALLARRLKLADDEQKALKRHSLLRKAREDLPEALETFVRVRSEPGNRPEDRAACCMRLGAISRQLGWELEAREWDRLAAEASPS